MQFVAPIYHITYLIKLSNDWSLFIYIFYFITNYIISFHSFSILNNNLLLICNEVFKNSQKNSTFFKQYLVSKWIIINIIELTRNFEFIYIYK